MNKMSNLELNKKFYILAGLGLGSYIKHVV